MTTLTREQAIGLAEIATILGKKRRAVHYMHQNGQLPVPLKHPWGPKLLWDADEIKRWAAEKYPRIFSA